MGCRFKSSSLKVCLFFSEKWSQSGVLCIRRSAKRQSFPFLVHYQIRPIWSVLIVSLLQKVTLLRQNWTEPDQDPASLWDVMSPRKRTSRWSSGLLQESIQPDWRFLSSSLTRGLFPTHLHRGWSPPPWSCMDTSTAWSTTQAGVSLLKPLWPPADVLKTFLETFRLLFCLFVVIFRPSAQIHRWHHSWGIQRSAQPEPRQLLPGFQSKLFYD